MLMTIFGQLVQQIMPLFVTQRALYEVRERPSKAYSWKAFMMSNIIVELPWSVLCAILIFVTWYYPIGLYANAEPTNAVHERGALMFLYILEFLLFTSTFAHMAIAGIADAETGGNIAQLAFSLTLVFCGVLVGPKALPGFWIFMYVSPSPSLLSMVRMSMICETGTNGKLRYRVSPFTYLIDGMLSTAVAHTTVTCASNEYLHFTPPSGQTCAQYMASYIDRSGGYLQNPASTGNCSYCPISETDTFLVGASAHPQYMWRNWGIMWAFILFNVAGAVALYWLVRVPKKKRGEKGKKEVVGPSADATREGSVLEKPPPVDGTPGLTEKETARGADVDAEASSTTLGTARQNETERPLYHDSVTKPRDHPGPAQPPHIIA